MNQVATIEHRSVTVDMAARFGMEPRAFEATVRSTCMPGENVSKEQFAAFLLVAKEYELNPLTKEIYAFPTKGGGVQPVVSIDGWMNLINSHPQMDGLEFADHLDGDKLTAVTARIYRKDRKHPTEVTEYMAECARGTEPWKKWPRRMLRHKAAIQAARYAFGFAGIVDPDEAERGEMRNVTPPAPPPVPAAIPVADTTDIDPKTGETIGLSPLGAAIVEEDAAARGVDPITDQPAADPETGEVTERLPDETIDEVLDDLEAQLAGATDVESVDDIWSDVKPRLEAVALPPDLDKAQRAVAQRKAQIETQ